MLSIVGEREQPFCAAHCCVVPSSSVPVSLVRQGRLLSQTQFQTHDVPYHARNLRWLSANSLKDESVTYFRTNVVYQSYKSWNVRFARGFDSGRPLNRNCMSMRIFVGYKRAAN